MGADDVIVIDDDDVIVIDDDVDVTGANASPQEHEAEHHRFGDQLGENQRLFMGFVGYLLVGVGPALLLATASTATGAVMIGVKPGTAPSPWVVVVGDWLPIATACAIVIGAITGALIIAWCARTTASRVAGFTLLLTIHPTAALLAGSMALFGGAVAANQPTRHVTIKHPVTAGRRATVSRIQGEDCGWELTESQGAQPVAQIVQEVTCVCTGMPEATARWTQTDPVLVDANTGSPYVCQQPRRRCATAPAPAAPWALLALLLTRRRRARRSHRPHAARSAEPR